MPNLERRLAFAASHLGNIRIFALWGVLDALIYMLVKDNRIKSAIIYFTIFISITIIGFYSPMIIDFL